MNVDSGLLVKIGIIAQGLYHGISDDTAVRFYPNNKAVVSKARLSTPLEYGPSTPLEYSAFSVESLELQAMLIGKEKTEIYMAYSQRCDVLAIYIPVDQQFQTESLAGQTPRPEVGNEVTLLVDLTYGIASIDPPAGKGWHDVAISAGARGIVVTSPLPHNTVQVEIEIELSDGEVRQVWLYPAEYKLTK